MSGNLRIQGQPPQRGIETPKPKAKSSKKEKITDLVQSRPLTIGQARSKEHSYAQLDRTLNQKTISQIFYDVYASHTQLPPNIKKIIQDYLPVETKSMLGTSFSRTIPEFVDLTNLYVLKTYLGSTCNSAKHVSAALEIAKRSYQVQKRSFISPKFGMAFPMDPEILAYAMRQAKNETVLEIAGASGENAILLAFAGAKKVYFNEIDEGELSAFNSLRQKLPTDVNKKLESITGDCLDIMKIKPELKGQLGLILCRNLIHFFNDQQQDAFFKMVHTLLKPGGRVVLMVNSTYTFPEYRQFFDDNADSTCFTQSLCLVSDYNISQLPFSKIAHQFSVCPPHQLSLNYTNLFLYHRDSTTGFKWKVDNDQFKTLDFDLRESIQKAFDLNKDVIKKIKHGSVRVLINTMRVYTKESLLSLCSVHGFETESIFVVANDGHVLKDDEPLVKGNQVGIICKKPE